MSSESFHSFSPIRPWPCTSNNNIYSTRLITSTSLVAEKVPVHVVHRFESTNYHVIGEFPLLEVDMDDQIIAFLLPRTLLPILPLALFRLPSPGEEKFTSFWFGSSFPISSTLALLDNTIPRVHYPIITPPNTDDNKP